MTDEQMTLAEQLRREQIAVDSAHSARVNNALLREQQYQKEAPQRAIRAQKEAARKQDAYNRVMAAREKGEAERAEREREAAREREAKAEASFTPEEKAALRSAYLATPGASEWDWQKAWPHVRDTKLRERAEQREADFKAGLKRRYNA